MSYALWAVEIAGYALASFRARGPVRLFCQLALGVNLTLLACLLLGGWRLYTPWYWVSLAILLAMGTDVASRVERRDPIAFLGFALWGAGTLVGPLSGLVPAATLLWCMRLELPRDRIGRHECE